MFGKKVKKSRSKSRSKSHPRRKKAQRTSVVKNYARSSCNGLNEHAQCSSDPNCHWTKSKKSPCRARSGVRKGNVYEGPMNKPLQ